MPNAIRQHEIAALRARIAAVEKRPPLAEEQGADGGTVDVGWPALLAAPGGLLHEVHFDRSGEGATALGFAFGLARRLLSRARPALVHLQLAHAGQELGLPYGGGFSAFGLDPGALVLGRPANLIDLLWATEEAAACGAVAAVVAEIAGAPRALDFTASRRLSLRAGTGGASILLLRQGAERMASAARFRWHIAPAQSPPAVFDALAPGLPRWRVTLEKGGLDGHARQEGNTVLVDWTENGFALANRQAGADAAHDRRSRPAASGAEPDALGNRLSQAG